MVLVLIFIVQLPASAIKFYYYGISELTMGTYGVRGGGLTTIFPIIVLGYAVGYYAYYKEKGAYVLLALCYVLYGIAGAKRALIFLYPFFMSILYYLICLREIKVNIAKHASIIVLMVCLSIGFAAINLEYNPTLSFQANRNIFHGKQIDNEGTFSYLLDYTQNYNKLSRQATFTAVLEGIFKGGLPQIFFGFGPGALTGSLFWDERLSSDQKTAIIKRGYGITGAGYVLTEYGFTGLTIIGFIFLAFCFMCWRYYNLETQPYWKAFATGSLIFTFIIVFDFLAYSNMCIVSETLLPIFYYTMAVVRVRSTKRAEIAPSEKS